MNMKKVDLKQYVKKYSYKGVHNYGSQFGEDGVLKEIFETIGTTNKFFVEFGSSGERKGGPNTAFLRDSCGFDGVLMDGQERPESTFPVHHEWITAANINDLLDKYDVPDEFDLLSIDIDNNDFYVWREIVRQPRVVVIEYNSCLLPTDDMVVPYDSGRKWEGGPYFGSSLFPLFKLGELKGYSLVATVGVNAIFVRNEDIPDDISFVDANDIQKHDTRRERGRRQSIIKRPWTSFSKAIKINTEEGGDIK
jgi:hypothetical protein